jgi:Zn-dependent M28 family amino/carboxypeptidase
MSGTKGNISKAIGVLLLSIEVVAPHGAWGAALISPEQKNAAQRITLERLRGQIRFLASDLLEGRGPATRGDQLAEAYIQSELETLGLEPGAPGGGWVQKVPLVAVKPSFPGPALFRSDRGTTTGTPGESIIAASGIPTAEAKIDGAEIVFVGYGIVAHEFQWDDYKDMDLKGKVLLIMNNDPETDPNLFAGKIRLWYGRFDYKYLMAAKKGAAGAIIIHTTPSAGYPWQVVQTTFMGERFYLRDESSPRVPIRAWATEELSKKIVELGGKNLDELRSSAETRAFRPVPLGVKMSFSLTNTIVEKESGNVIGVIRGSDPKRSSEAVIYTAHHDHFGIKTGIKPGEDAIYNGAIDNASGVAALVSIAGAFAELKVHPRRSIYFAFVAGEEQELIGSAYLVQHPPVPIGRITANINIDGLGWFGRTRDIEMIGSGKSSIDKDVTVIAKVEGRKAVPDQFPERGFFYRADSLNFARAGIPVAYLKRGIDVIGKPEGFGRDQVEAYIKKNYHQPSDEFKEALDFSGAVEDVKLMFYLGCREANADGMPQWNKGDEFEAARKKALADVSER